MFDIGWSELLLIGIVALIAIGPKELPGALRSLGQWMTKIRRMASEFQNQFQDAMREAELSELKKEVDEMTAKAQNYAHFDPIEDIRRDIESAVAPPETLNTPVMETPAAAPPAEASLPDVPPPASEPAVSGNPVEVTEAPPAPPAPPETVGAVAGETKPDAGRAA